MFSGGIQYKISYDLMQTIEGNKISHDIKFLLLKRPNKMTFYFDLERNEFIKGKM